VTRWEHEPDVVSSRAVLLVMGGSLVAVLISVVVARMLSGDAPGPRTAAEPGEPIGVPPEVNGMETQPFAVGAQGIDEHRRTEEFLMSYGWVDREAGIVHIPIERAIDLYLERQGGRR
jgi:hypothetical protein